MQVSVWHIVHCGLSNWFCLTRLVFDLSSVYLLYEFGNQKVLNLLILVEKNF